MKMLLTITNNNSELLANQNQASQRLNLHTHFDMHTQHVTELNTQPLQNTQHNNVTTKF